MMDRLWRSTARPALILLVIAALGQAFGFPSPQEEGEDVYVAIKAGTILPVEGEAIQNGVIVIRNGLIEAMGANVEFPREAKIIHAEDQVVMPALINPCTALGNKKYSRSGVHTDLKAADEYEYDPRVHGRLLQCGFAVLGLVPSGMGLPDRKSVV